MLSIRQGMLLLAVPVAIGLEEGAAKSAVRNPLYNVAVATPAPHKSPADDKSSHHHHRHAAYAAEATGLLLMAVLLLILIVIRYWSNIPWSAR